MSKAWFMCHITILTLLLNALCTQVHVWRWLNHNKIQDILSSVSHKQRNNGANKAWSLLFWCCHQRPRNSEINLTWCTYAVWEISGLKKEQLYAAKTVLSCSVPLPFIMHGKSLPTQTEAQPTPVRRSRDINPWVRGCRCQPGSPACC